jgi:hypothetical protein
VSRQSSTHDIIWHGMTWHGMTWHGMTWHGMTWHGMNGSREDDRMDGWIEGMKDVLYAYND